MKEVITMMITKNIIFWAVTPYNLVQIYPFSERTYFLQFLADCLIDLLFHHKTWSLYVNR